MELFKLFGSIVIKDGSSKQLDDVEKKAKNADLGLSGLGKTCTDIGKNISNFGSNLTKFLTVPLIAAGSAIIKLADTASDLNEAQNVVENTFKTSSKEIEAWTNTTAKSAGISKTASTQWVGFMGAMLKSSGVTEKAAGDMSKNLVQLTGDMSSFYNVSTSDMWEKIRSGISGETEPLKALGINLSVANLSAYALAQGIKKPYDQMSQSEQTILRYNYLLSVTKDAQGDFGRTLNDSFANQGRVAMLNLQNLVTTLGSKFLPVVMESTKKVNEFMEALNTALNGGNASDKLGKTINDIANAIGKLTPDKIKSILSIGAALASLGPGITIFGKLTEGTGSFLKALSEGPDKITKFTSGGIQLFKNFSTSAGESISKISDLTAFQKLGSRFTELGSNFEWMTQKIKYGSNLTPIIDGIGNGVSSAIGKISNMIPQNVQSSFSNILATVTAETPKLGEVFGDLSSKVFSGLQSMVGLALKMIAPAALIGVLLLGLGVAQQQMGTQLDNVITMITQKGPILIQNFTASLLARIPDLINSGTTLLMNLINALIANAPSLISAAVAIISSLVNGITTNLPRLIPMVLNLIQTILTSIINNLPKLVMAGFNLLVALAQGISNNTGKIVNTITTVLTKLISVIAQNLPQIISAGVKILVAIISGISKAIPQLIAALPKIFSAIVNGLKKMDWGSIGRNIINGIKEGVSAVASGLANSVKEAAKAALNGVKNFLGIHSPSRKFRDEIGKYIPAGIAVGIEDNGDVVNDELGKLANDLVFDPDLGATVSANMVTSAGVNLSSNTTSAGNISNLIELLKAILELVKVIANNPPEFNVDGKELARLIADPVSEEIAWKSQQNKLAYGGVKV